MMKLFGTTDINVIKDCQAYFGTQPPSGIFTKRRCKFLEQYRNSSNCLCHYFWGLAIVYCVYCEYCLHYFLFFLPFTVNKVMYKFDHCVVRHGRFCVIAWAIFTVQQWSCDQVK